MAATRYCPPLYFSSLEDSRGQVLERIPFQEASVFSEAQLQEWLFNHPESLPMRQIDPSFGPVARLCQELPVGDNYLDLAYVNETGRLMLVECKLWKNPQSRREVIGQILDYAADIAKWDYEQLSDAVSKATGRPGTSMYEIVSERFPSLDEATFVDDVERCLREGRSLLAIAGDGIRENVEKIVSFMQLRAVPQFSFALIEVGVYRMNVDGNDGLFVQPRVHARTVEIERSIYGRPDMQESVKIGENSLFDETCDKFSGLKEFIKRLEDLDIRPVVKKTIVLRYADSVLGNLNFGTIYPDGRLTLNYICDSAEVSGNLSIGEDYLCGIAELIPGSVVLKRGYPWTWTVRADQNGRWLSIESALKHSDEWIRLIKETLERFKERKRIIGDQ